VRNCWRAGRGAAPPLIPHAVPAGKLRLLKDAEARSVVLELVSSVDFRKAVISFPEGDKEIGTELPCLSLHVKSFNRHAAERLSASPLHGAA
jgi:hypothetical protein